jgi:hypothetical protein
MKPGDVVMWRTRQTTTGFPVDMGAYQLRQQIGTIENYWLMQEQSGQFEFKGRCVKAFAYEEDLLYVLDEATNTLTAVPAKPKLTVIQGGADAREKAEKAFNKEYFRRVFENTKHLFPEEDGPQPGK